MGGGTAALFFKLESDGKYDRHGNPGGKAHRQRPAAKSAPAQAHADANEQTGKQDGAGNSVEIVAKSGKWDVDLPVNAEALGKLMLHYRDVDAFLQMSSTAVYEYAGHEPRSETSALGDNHRNMFETYSISKIAAETVARFVAGQYEIPLTIARLNVPYGSFPCWPYFQFKMMQNSMPIDVHPDRPNAYSPIHCEDYIDKIPYLLAAACKETTVVNLAGCEVVTVEEWCDYMGDLTGLTPIYNETTSAVGSLTCDTSKMVEICGETRIDWKSGFREMLAAMAPDAMK